MTADAEPVRDDLVAAADGAFRSRRARVATRSPLAFDLDDLVSVGLEDHDPSVRKAIARAMDPIPVSSPGQSAPDVVLIHEPSAVSRLAIDILRPAGDTMTTVSDGHSHYIDVGGRRCSLPDPWCDEQVVFRYERGFPLSRILGPVVRPTLQVSIHRAGGATMHATSVEIDGGAVLIAGWSESGKTEVALALVEAGAWFVSDKWSVVRPDGRVSAFPIGVGIRRWLLPFLPGLRRSLPRAARLQFSVAAVGELIAAPARAADGQHPLASAVAELAGRSIRLADRASVRTSDVRRLFGEAPGTTATPPLSAVVLLTTVPSGTPPLLQSVTLERAATRLARTAAYERRPFFALRDRAAYAFPGSQPSPEIWVAEEHARLTRLLAGVRLLEVRLPFPTDPRPVAEVIRSHLC